MPNRKGNTFFTLNPDGTIVAQGEAIKRHITHLSEKGTEKNTSLFLKFLEEWYKNTKSFDENLSILLGMLVKDPLATKTLKPELLSKLVRVATESYGNAHETLLEAQKQGTPEQLLKHPLEIPAYQLAHKMLLELPELQEAEKVYTQLETRLAELKTNDSKLRSPVARKEHAAKIAFLKEAIRLAAGMLQRGSRTVMPLESMIKEKKFLEAYEDPNLCSKILQDLLHTLQSTAPKTDEHKRIKEKLEKIGYTIEELPSLSHSEAEVFIKKFIEGFMPTELDNSLGILKDALGSQYDSRKIGIAIEPPLKPMALAQQAEPRQAERAQKMAAHKAARQERAEQAVVRAPIAQAAAQAATVRLQERAAQAAQIAVRTPIAQAAAQAAITRTQERKKWEEREEARRLGVGEKTRAARDQQLQKEKKIPPVLPSRPARPEQTERASQPKRM